MQLARAGAIATACALVALAACDRLPGIQIVDGTADGGSADAGSASASPSPGDAGDAGAGAPCTARFCDDFDDPSEATSPFGFETASAGLSLSGAPTTSPPNALHASLVDAGGNDSITVDEPLATTSDVTSVVVDLALFPATIEVAAGSTHPIEIHCGTGGTVASAKLKGGPTLMVGSGADEQKVGTLAAGQWHHLHLELSAVNGVTLSADDGALPATTIALADICRGTVVVHIGNTPTSGTGTYDLFVDDVAIDWK